MNKLATFVFLLMMMVPMGLAAQGIPDYSSVITEEAQRDAVEHLCDSIMEGRASGSPGIAAAADYISGRFREMELKPFFYHGAQPFRSQTGIRMKNIIGVVPALEPSDDYIIISAHYDHLGIIKGKVYPGADDNASGVAALLSIAEAFSRMRRDSIAPNVNLLFIAFDGKEYSMTGSRYFSSEMPIATSNIICEVNMDILGSTLVPVGKNPEYLIVLGRNTLPEKYRNIIDGCNRAAGMGLDIDYTFYGSDDFTRTMYKLGDHYPFSQKGVPALLFTSGFHQHTLKTTDTPEIIDHKVLAKRTRLIYQFILEIIRRQPR